MTALVIIDGGRPATTSVLVAQKFKKSHKNVLQAIRNMECSATFRGLNFQPTIREIPGPKGAIRKESAFLISRSGFAFLAMGFTGKEAAQFKEDYIAEFDAMEEELKRRAIQIKDAYWQQRRAEGKSVRLELTGAVQEFVSYAKGQGSQSAEKYYMSITKMEYAALELVKQASDKNFRDTLDAVQHTELTVVELACQQALRQGMTEGLHYKDIYQMAKVACVQLAAQLRKYLPGHVAANDDTVKRIAGGKK